MPGSRRFSPLAVLGSVGLILSSLLVVRLWFLQVVDQPALEARVREVRTRTVKLPA